MQEGTAETAGRPGSVSYEMGGEDNTAHAQGEGEQGTGAAATLAALRAGAAVAAGEQWRPPFFPALSRAQSYHGVGLGLAEGFSVVMSSGAGGR